MIPAFIDEDAPRGERDVFNLLARGPSDWTVLHSLDLSPWRDSKRTEVDYAVIMPDTGILCIEVKSHSTIEFTNGKWSPATIRKSPFKQALDARFALQRGLAKLAEQTRTIPFGSCCIFPNAPFQVRSNLSIAPAELMDVSVFRRFRSGEELAQELRGRLKAIIAAERQQPLHAPLDSAHVDDVVALCLPVRLRRPSAAEEVSRRRREIDELLRQPQKPVLELASLNPRLLVTGAAGTGKTLVAMELAQRCADEGARVALVCFNRVVGKWMKEQCEKRWAGPNLLVDSASRLLVHLADLEVPAEANEAFWTDRVPSAVEERLTSPEFQWEARFDVLVVDEVQDIFARPALWHSLVALLEGGATNGRYMLFGDLEHQVLKDRDEMQAVCDELCARVAVVRWHMSENCRNLRTVGEAALALSGMPETTYSSYLRSGGTTTDVRIEAVETDEAAAARVRHLIGEARALGYRERDITLLSFVADERSVARALVAQGMRIMPAERADAEVRYSSIHAYKGMENEVIVVTDTRVDMGELGRSLFYTALTRATSKVTVICRKTDTHTLIQWLTGGVQ